MRKKVLSLVLVAVLIFSTVILASCDLLTDALNDVIEKAVTMDAYRYQLEKKGYDVAVANTESIEYEEVALKNVFGAEADIVAFINAEKEGYLVYVYELADEDDARTFADAMDEMYKTERSGKFVVISQSQQALDDARLDTSVDLGDIGEIIG